MAFRRGSRGRGRGRRSRSNVKRNVRGKRLRSYGSPRGGVRL